MGNGLKGWSKNLKYMKAAENIWRGYLYKINSIINDRISKDKPIGIEQEKRGFKIPKQIKIIQKQIPLY